MDDPLIALTRLEGVASAMAASRDGLDAILRDRGLRRTAPESTTESLLRGAYASAVLEGSTATIDQVRADGGDQVSRATLRVSTEVLGLQPVLSRSPSQALARLHTLAARDIAPPAALGRPVSADAAARLAGVAAVLTESTSAPGLVLAAVVHAELATARCFASRNGVVARAAERLILASRGVDTLSLAVPEVAHLRHRDDYESALEAYRSGGTTGVHRWLLYAAEAYARAGEASPLNDHSQTR